MELGLHNQSNLHLKTLHKEAGLEFPSLFVGEAPGDSGDQILHGVSHFEPQMSWRFGYFSVIFVASSCQFSRVEKNSPHTWLLEGFQEGFGIIQLHLAFDTLG